MRETKDLLHRLDEAEPPDVWRSATSRTVKREADLDETPGRGRRAMVVVVAAVLSIVTVAVLIVAFTAAKQQVPSSPITKPAQLVPHGHIVYATQTSDSLDATVSLRSISPEGGTPTPVQIPGIDATFVGEPAWSRDGSRLAIVVGPTGHVHAYAGDGNLVVVDAAGTNVLRVTSGLVASSPAWSPDGKQLVFVRHQGQQLVVVNADGSDQRVVSKDRRYYQAPSWSPDGRWIAFQSRAAVSPSSEDTAVFLIRPDGTGMHQVPGTDGGGEPAWSPDGTLIAYRGIRVTGANGSDTRILTRCPRPCGHYDSAPAWSPDGSQVVFVRQADRDGTFELYVVDLATGKVRSLTPSETDVGRASWRP